MATRRQTANPFYGILLVAGVAFALTACAYGVMIVHKMDPDRTAAGSTEGTWVIEFMDDHGATTMIAELAVLAIATGAAIGTDRIRARRAKSGSVSDTQKQSEGQENER